MLFQLENMAEDHKQEIELLRRQIESEKTTIRNLEDLLTANKESEFGLSLSVQEKESEIQLFKERLALSESKWLQIFTNSLVLIVLNV